MNERRIAALQAMAAADESPNEQRTARTKLAEAGIPIEPPRPPAPPAAAPMPMPMNWGWTGTSTGTSNTVNGSWSGTIYVRFVFHG